MKKLLVFAVVILGFTAVSFGQQGSATLSTASASAKIISPITLTLVNNMVFGAIATSPAGGTVILGLDNSRIASGVTLGTNAGVQAAKFTVGGEGTAHYKVTLPADNSVTLISGASGAKPMNLTAFIDSPDAGTLTAGTQDFSVAATLNIPAAQVAGDYTATFPVTVTYE